MYPVYGYVSSTESGPMKDKSIDTVNAGHIIVCVNSLPCAVCSMKSQRRDRGQSAEIMKHAKAGGPSSGLSDDTHSHVHM